MITAVNSRTRPGTEALKCQFVIIAKHPHEICTNYSNPIHHSSTVTCPERKWKLLSHVQHFATHGLYPARLLCPWTSPGKNTGVGSHSPLQGIFSNSGIETRSPTLQADSLLSQPPGKPITCLCYLEIFFCYSPLVPKCSCFCVSLKIWCKC